MLCLIILTNLMHIILQFDSYLEKLTVQEL